MPTDPKAARERYPLTSDTQVAIVRQILADPILLPRLAPHIQSSKFGDEPARLLVEAALGYYKEYDEVPTLTTVLQEIRRSVDAGQVPLDKVAECAEYLDAAADLPPIATAYAANLILHEERAAAMYGALDHGWQNYKQRTSEAFEAIERDVIKANQITSLAELSVGTDLAKDLAARTQLRREGRVVPRWGTGIVDLDDALAGGLAAGELGCILAGPKTGKSTALDQISIYLAGLGGTVAYVTLEMGEAQISDRHDAAISMTPINSLQAQHQLVDKRVGDWFTKSGGSILVKYMPPRETTSRELRAWLQWLRATKGIRPTVLIVDYGDLLGAASSDYEKRHEELGIVYTELRSVAHDFKVPCWTASQVNREGLEKKVITVANVAESFKKVAICDVLVAICRTEDERVSRQLRLFIAACRFATDGAILGPYSSGFDVGRLVIGNALDEGS